MLHTIEAIERSTGSRLQAVNPNNRSKLGQPEAVLQCHCPSYTVHPIPIVNIFFKKVRASQRERKRERAWYLQRVAPEAALHFELHHLEGPADHLCVRACVRVCVSVYVCVCVRVCVCVCVRARHKDFSAQYDGLNGEGGSACRDLRRTQCSSS